MNDVCPNCGSQRGSAEDTVCPDCGVSRQTRQARPDDWMWMRNPIPPPAPRDRRGAVTWLAAAPRTWIALSLVLAVTAIAGVVFSVQTYRDGADWKERALAFEERAGELESRVRASEADVDRLQSRIDALANEKAAAEDDLVVAEQERDVAVEIAGLASDAVVDARVCLDAITVALADVIDFYNDGFGSPDISLDYAQSVCETADGSFADFAAAVDRLG